MANNDPVYGSITINGTTVKVALPQTLADEVTHTAAGRTLVLSSVTTKRSIGSEALEITEIVENVLQHCSALELFGLQRVSPKFRAVISCNKAFRKKMWLDKRDPSHLDVPPAQPLAIRIATRSEITRVEAFGIEALVQSWKFRKATWPLSFRIVGSVVKVEINHHVFFPESKILNDYKSVAVRLSSWNTTMDSWRQIILPMHEPRLELSLLSSQQIEQRSFGVVAWCANVSRAGTIVTLADAVDVACETAAWWYKCQPGISSILSRTLLERGLISEDFWRMRRRTVDKPRARAVASEDKRLGGVEGGLCSCVTM